MVITINCFAWMLIVCFTPWSIVMWCQSIYNYHSIRLSDGLQYIQRDKWKDREIELVIGQSANKRVQVMPLF